jgi:multidrug efflux pump subunit AcrA (membrane-fusion protein)
MCSKVYKTQIYYPETNKYSTYISIKRWKILIITRIKTATLTVILPISLLLCSCGLMPGSDVSEIEQYVSAPLTATVIRTSLTYTSTQAATVIPRSIQNLCFDGVSGTLTAVYAGANEFVKQGDILAEIDPSEQLASIERSRIDKRILEIRKQQRELEGLALEAAFTAARDKYSKAATGYSANPTDDTKQAADKAQAQYIQAAYSKEMFDLNSSISDLDYDKLNQTTEKLVSDLENCIMTAPSDGVVLSVSELSLGNRMDAKNPIFSFVSTTDLLLGVMSRDSMYLRGEENIKITINGLLYEAHAYEPVEATQSGKRTPQ